MIFPQIFILSLFGTLLSFPTMIGTAVIRLFHNLFASLGVNIFYIFFALNFTLKSVRPVMSLTICFPFCLQGLLLFC